MQRILINPILAFFDRLWQRLTNNHNCFKLTLSSGFKFDYNDIVYLSKNQIARYIGNKVYVYI